MAYYKALMLLELQFHKCWFWSDLFDLLLIGATGQTIKNLKNLCAIVTLTKQGDHYRFGHNKVLLSVVWVNDSLESLRTVNQSADLRLRLICEGSTVTVTL